MVTRPSTFSLSEAMSDLSDEGAGKLQVPVLPQLRRRDFRTQVARDWTHVAVQQLEPRPERIGQLVRMVQPASGDRAVSRIQSASTDRWSASTDVSYPNRTTREPIIPRRPSASTDKDPRLWSVPTRRRTGLVSCCPTWWACVQMTSGPPVIASMPCSSGNALIQPRPRCSIGAPSARLT